MENFNLMCFEFLEGKNYEEGSFNDLVMELIDTGKEYLDSLDELKSTEFQKLSNRINDIKNALGEDSINYGDEFLIFYKNYYNIN